MRLILNLQPYSLGIVCCCWSLEEVPYGLVSIFSADDFECNSRFTAWGRRCQNPTQLDKDHLDLNLSAFLSLLPSIFLCSSLEYCFFSPRVFLMSELYTSWPCFSTFSHLVLCLCLMAKKQQSRLPPQPVISRRALLIFHMSSPVCLKSTVLVIVSFHHSLCALLCIWDVCKWLPTSIIWPAFWLYS